MGGIDRAICSFMDFDEPVWVRMIFLLSDTQAWLDEMEQQTFRRLPLPQLRKVFRREYFLTATAFAHLLERHYNRMGRHPGKSKFTIDIPGIMGLIRDAGAVQPVPVPGQATFMRCLDTGREIGYDRLGCASTVITVVQEADGRISTAFPGRIQL